MDGVRTRYRIDSSATLAPDDIYIQCKMRGQGPSSYHQLDVQDGVAGVHRTPAVSAPVHPSPDRLTPDFRYAATPTWSRFEAIARLENSRRRIYNPLDAPDRTLS